MPQFIENKLRHCSWQRGWDSNPRALAGYLISSQGRYDHFDTPPQPYYCNITEKIWQAFAGDNYYNRAYNRANSVSGYLRFKVNCEGVTPILLLNTLEKYSGSEKPHTKAISFIAVLPSCMRAQAAFMRRFAR